MPILDRQEANDLDLAIESVVSAPSLESALQSLRRVFVERLDFDSATGLVSLHAAGMPPNALRIAHRDGVQVVAVALPETARVTAAKIQIALRDVRQSLGGDLLLAVTDQARSQWDFVYPCVKGGREILRRMVVRPGEPRRTVVEQLASVYWATTPTGDLRQALEEAYNVEAVTKRFFARYKLVFDRVIA